MDTGDKSTTKRARTGSSSNATENRKIRNRLSQKAFRARQSIYIKELEKRLELSSKSGTDHNAELEEANKELRTQLLDCHKKLESIQITLKSLSASVSTTLGIETRNSSPSGTSQDGIDEVLPYSQNNSQSASSIDHALARRCNSTDFQGRDLIDHGNIIGKEASQQRLDNFMFFAGNGHCSPTNPQIPVSYQQVMGPLEYRDIATNGRILLQDKELQLRRTNSGWSDHIAVCEGLLRHKWLRSGSLLNHGDDRLAASVYFMLSTFICLSWPTMTAWHTHTKSHIPVAKLMTWNVNPTPTTYMDLSTSIGTDWVPTELQLSVSHPAIIDWIPFPALRDKLILYHSGNPCLDDIICDIGNSYVAETDLSKLVVGLSSAPGYVSVWDLIRVISPQSTGNSSLGTSGSDPTAWSGLFGTEFTQGSPNGAEQAENLLCSLPTLPAPSVDVLFTSETLALLAFKTLNMDKGAGTFKLDPTFFERHPELYDSKAGLMANGFPLRPPRRKPMQAPRPLDDSVLERYRELAAWTLDFSHDSDL